MRRGSAATAAGGEALVDAAGTRHAPAGVGARIVSLVPSLTELLVHLGLAERLVGRTHYCVHPAETVEAIPSVGGTKKVKMERLRALRPTHVIVNVDENPRDMVAAIAAFVPHVVVTHPLGPDDNVALYRLFGGIFGREAEAERLVREFRAARARLRRRAAALPARDVLYLIWKDPWMTVSRETYVSRLLALVKWRTVAHDPAVRYPRIEITDALLAKTDAVLFSTEPYPFTEADVVAFRAVHGAPAAVLIDGAYTQWYGWRAIEGLHYLGDVAAALAGRRRERSGGSPTGPEA